MEVNNNNKYSESFKKYLSEYSASEDSNEELSLEKALEIISLQNKELDELRESMHDQRARLQKTNRKMRNRTIELFGRMVDLKKAKKTISFQNQQLEKQSSEIEQKRSSLEQTYKKYRERTIELFGRMVDLKKAKKTIVQQNEKLNKQRKELDETNATKDKFFSIIAHDLKNPIGGFLQLTDILSENNDELTHEESKELIEMMNKNSKHLYSLLENLLHWSRAQTGSISFNPQNLLLKETIQDTAELLKMNLENKDIKLQVEVNEGTKVNADSNMLSTILRNLISNAIKYSNSGSKIIIRSEPLNQFIKISVRDFGIGINPNEQEKLFKPGHNISKSGTAEEKGTGLGLLVCKEFVERHNGQIWLKSEPKSGTDFHFTMPGSQ